VSDIRESVRKVGQSWENSPYYENAERLIDVFWRDGTLFRRLFEKLDLTTTVELACGHGRHAERITPDCGRLTLMDIHVGNIDFCKNRLSRFTNVEYFVNNGFDFQPLPPASQTAIFCYDAMVHFSPDVVRSYVIDTARVLKQGGLALFHHSNYPALLDVPYSRNPQARNHMTRGLFAQYCGEANLLIEEAKVIQWGGEPDLDCVTLVRRA
jgi:SAM-dependent methyltransferase